MSVEVISNIIMTIEDIYKNSKKELIITTNGQVFMIIENSNEDFNEFIDLIRDVMNLKILISSEEREWLTDSEYRTDLLISCNTIGDKITRQLLKETGPDASTSSR